MPKKRDSKRPCCMSQPVSETGQISVELWQDSFYNKTGKFDRHRKRDKE